MNSAARYFTTSLALVCAFAAAPAMAARPDLRAMACEQGKALLLQRGAIVFTTGQYTYERIVHNRGFCTSGQETILYTTPAYDDPRCRIGYVCKDRVITR